MAKENVTYRPEFYQSVESQSGPYAVSPDDTAWYNLCDPFETLELAKAVCADWALTGSYKTTRVVELVDGNPTSVVWMSVWDAPFQANPEAGAGTGQPGESIKLLVWMDRDEGHLDHWNFQKKFQKTFEGNNNAWDLAYARPVDTVGRMIQYSVRLNLWPVGKKPVAEWNWYKVFNKDPELQADEIEVVRAHEIEPRAFPAGVDTVDCTFCGKTVEQAKSWESYNPDTDDYDAPYCSCRCIDERFDENMYRTDPDGIEHEDPGCVHMVETAA